jgi:ribonuclease R
VAGKEFKSFKDLLGGGQPAPKQEGEIRLSGDLAKKGEEAARHEDVVGEGARERIGRRPSSFGPMDHGPARYKDVESEEMVVLGSFRVRTVFPADVLREVSALPADPGEEDKQGRLDLRGELIYTIDGADAKDYDDAISIKALDDGAWEVGVHIADVSHYVRKGTALDDEALARATSVYLADQVVPMLPEQLSNNLCSLVGGRDRLAYSVLMVFDRKGQRLSAKVAKSVIRSVRRNTYKDVQDLLDGVVTEATIEMEFLKESLENFRAWTLVQQKSRDQKGSMRLQSSEKKFRFDERGEPKECYEADRYFSQALIEETALAANQAVGDLFRAKGLPTIYRVHPEKDPEEIEKLAAMLETHGIRVPKKERLTGRDIARLIVIARKRPNAEALVARIMGLVERAVYEVKDHEDVATHFGLARRAYLHFTSPIRRYPDLIVHRWLWAVETRLEEASKELKVPEMVDDLVDIASHCSTQAEMAEMAEQTIFDLKVCQYMEPSIGETLEAQVVRVNPAGMEVKLIAHNVHGFLPARSIGEKVHCEGPVLKITAGRRHLSFTEGHPIQVKIKDVDFLRLQVLLELG